MVAVINSSPAGDLDPGFGGSGGPVATAIAVVRQTSLNSSTGDALSAQVSYGWDQVSGSARVVMPASTGGVGQDMTISLGAGNNVQRFSGTRREDDTTLAPHAVTAVGKGPLYLLEENENGDETIAPDEGKPGLDFETLVGGASATLRQIVTAVLTRVGVSYSLANLDNPPALYGVLAPENFTWGAGETAAAYLHRIFEATPGYRLFDSSDGNVYLRQVTAIPSGSPDYTFTLGRDIFGDTSALDSSLGQKGAVLVQGYDDGSGPATSGIVGSGSIFRVNSPLIETNALATTIASYWLPIVSRRQTVVRLSTPRDDLLGPGQTIFVNAPSLGVVMKLWLKSVTTEIAANAQFTQHLVCVVGV